MLSHFAELSGSFEAIDVTTDDKVIGTNKKAVIYVGVTGDLAVIGKNDNDIVTVLPNAPVGYHMLDIKTIKNVAGGTTASGLVILR